MYLWKYWRESRIVFSVVICGIAVLFAFVLRAENQLAIGNPPQSSNGLASLLPVAFMLQVFPACFLGLLYGSFGIGRDLGDKTGSFLFTRPRSRSFFVWHDWGCGIAQLLAVFALLNALIGLVVYRLLLASGDPLHGSLLIGERHVDMVSLVCLNIACILLLAGIVFSVTYFSTVLVRHGKGVMLGAGIVLCYIILKAVAAHYWPNLSLPNLVLGAFSPSHFGTLGIADHLGVSMAMRTLFILIFPFAAHLVLEKTDL